MREKFTQFYNKYHKVLLVIPAVLLILSLFIIFHTYYTTGDLIHRDVSLTGGTTISIFSNISVDELQRELLKDFSDISVRALSDTTGEQTQVVIVTKETPEKITPILEKYLGYKLDEKNSSIEFVGSSLSKDFYKQLMIAVALAFFWMSAVVFVIFSKKWNIKLLAILINLLFGIFLGNFLLKLPLVISVIISLAFVIPLFYIYIRYSIPSFAVILCAFADIVMTLAVVDLIGMKISGAGIVAFLMLIGYSVDTDILLTTRVLMRKQGTVNSETFGAFKTGMTMTLTAIASIAVALIFVYSFETALNQIFTILLIGLGFDIFNTWLTNAILIKWFSESQK
jgi:preprotein translocase subunit SecF